MLEVEFAQVSDCGKVRDHNEDYAGCVAPANTGEVRTRGWLFALADGVGGHEAGEVASHDAVETVLAGFRGAPAGEPHAALIRRLVQAANEHVYSAGHAARPGGVSMATTLVVCALRFDRAVVAHVGDSRCYLLRGNESTLLTRDHTVVNEQVRLGLLTAKEAAESSTRNVLTRSLGIDLIANVEISENQVLAGDVLLLCSDGLHGSVDGAEMAATVRRSSDLEWAAASLVALANERDGGDNISIQLIRVKGVERVGMYRGRPYKLPG
ncbi:MAG: protein phosphatase 2C domain-containing protein [Bryobacteraceae bacterium]|jgi:protein phosphatase